MNTNKTVLHHYLPEKLQVVLTHDLTDDYSWQDWTESVNEDSFKEGAVWTLSGFTDPKLMISSGEGELSEYILQREDRTWISVESKSFKPALHSMNRLTMPLENGEIPTEKILELINRDNLSNITHYAVKDLVMNLSDLYFTKDLTDTLRFSDFLTIKNYLEQNHFNLYNLPESEYIEKSTLKI